MVTQAELLKKLAELKNELKHKFGIEEFALFGSYVRNEAREDSDVDIAILKMKLKSGFDAIRAKNYLQEQLNRDVGMGMFKSIKTFIKNLIKKDFIYV